MSVVPVRQSLTANTPVALDVVDSLNDGQTSVFVTWISGGNVYIGTSTTTGVPLPPEGFSFSNLGYDEAKTIKLVAAADAVIGIVAQGV